MNVLRRVVIGGVVLGALVSAGDARAGVFRDVVRGLEFAGFSFSGVENPLSGGADFQLARNFNQETLDFGASALTLTGPVNFAFSTGGRQLPVLDFSLSTNNQALNYIFESSTGAQDYRVDGNFLLDATGSINTFGFYDLRVELSSRQDVSLDGRFQDGVDRELDYDIGPIDVSGNIFADLLARLFDPLFEALGAENIFDSLSGRLQRDSLLQTLVDDAQAAADLGGLLGADAAGKLLTPDDASLLPGADTPDLSLAEQTRAGGRVAQAAVPEPASFVLVLASALVLVGRRR